MLDWQVLQEDVAKLFMDLGCSATVNAKIQGARGLHAIDVWIEIKKFGIDLKWVVECKLWNSSVSKEKVLVLKSIVEDVGADRGIIISKIGYQSGANKFAKNTNVYLLTIDELKELTKQDLALFTIGTLEKKVHELKNKIRATVIITEESRSGNMYHSVYHYKSPNSMSILGKLAVLEMGFDEIRFNKPPYITSFDKSGNKAIFSNNLDEFIEHAIKIIEEGNKELN